MVQTDHDLLIKMNVEIENLKEKIEKLEKDQDAFKESTTKRIDDFFDLLRDANPKLSSNDQAAIIIAFVTSLASIILAILKYKST